MKRNLSLLLFFILLCCNLFGRQAVGTVFTLAQPDGKTFRAKLTGDEYARILQDENGRAIVMDSDGWYCYALFSEDGSRRSSGYIVGRETPADILTASLNIPFSALQRKAREHRKLFQTKSSNTATANCIFILVDFPDWKMTRKESDFKELIGVKLLNYFNCQFRGDMDFHFNITPLVTLDHNFAYYGENDSDGKDKKVKEAVSEACKKAAAAGFDFSGSDSDGDGIMDNLFVIFAGKDEADGAGDIFLWSQSGSFIADGIDYSINGIRIDRFSISTEYIRHTDHSFQFADIGVICHELSHSFGLMDMYDTDVFGSGGKADALWYRTNLMDGACMNLDSEMPANYSAIEYDQLGIGQPEELKAGSYVLEPIHINRRYLKYEGNTKGDYYLIECRMKEGWDEGIEGEGLLIYHIDKSDTPAGFSDYYNKTLTASQRWEENEINCRPDRECAKAISPIPGIRYYDAHGRVAGHIKDLFFPNGEYDFFSTESPSEFSFWNGEKSPLAIRNIRIQDGKCSFDVVNTIGIDIPDVVLSGIDIFQNCAIISWEGKETLFKGPAFVSWGLEGKEKTTIEVLPYTEGKYAIRLEGLTPGKSYNFSVRFAHGKSYGRELRADFVTRASERAYPHICLDSVSRNSDGSMPAGTLLPLVLDDTHGEDNISWFFDSKEISAEDCGYFVVEHSGTLKAVIKLKDGSVETVSKTISVR